MPRLIPRPRRAVLINSVIALAIALVIAMTLRTVADGGEVEGSSVQTAEVDRGEVTATVSASGNVESVDSIDVNFEGSGGTVTAIYVHEGVKVHKGQALAKVDDTSARQGLRSAQATLAAARGSYETLTQGRTDAELAQDQQSINVSEQSVESAQVGLQSARNTYSLDKQQHDAAVRRAEADLDSAIKARDRAQERYDADPTAENRQALQSARTAVDTARTAVITERNSRASVLLADRQNINTQTAALQAAQAQLQSTMATVQVNQQDPKAGDVTSAQAQIDSAQVTVEQAETELAKTVLRAPASGTVAEIGGVVGESSSSTSSGSTSSSDSSSDGSTGTSSDSSGGSSGFITMTAEDQLEVTAYVAEADINDVRVGQAATVTLAASDRELSGVVSSVDTIQTVTNNVVEYGVTVRLTETDNVRLGQTAQVAVTTGSKESVVRVSSSALTTIGDSTTATVRTDDGTTGTVTVQTGLQGDSETEIISGLSLGDVVVLPEQSGSDGNFTFPSGGLGGIGGP